MTDSQKIKVILQALINSSKVKNEREFCSKTGLDTGNLSKIQAGTRKIPASLILSMKDVFGINPEYLSNDKKPMFIDTPNETKPVPYYDIDATAGDMTIFAEDGEEYVKQYITVPAFSDCEMFINVWGNSMYPKYCSGELIALKRVNDLEIVPYNEAYLVVTKEQRLLKYIRKGTSKTHWKLCSENEEFEAFEIPIKKVLHLYMVKGKITKNII